jgi:hypothetical protein
VGAVTHEWKPPVFVTSRVLSAFSGGVELGRVLFVFRQPVSPTVSHVVIDVVIEYPMKGVESGLFVPKVRTRGVWVDFCL